MTWTEVWFCYEVLVLGLGGPSKEALRNQVWGVALPHEVDA